jgi:hypothetical protein
MKTLSFSHIKFADLQKVVKIRQSLNDDLFADWFAYDYAISHAEMDLLQALIAEHRTLMFSYSEDELKMKFLAPLLNAVKFQTDLVRDWYQRPLKATINHVTLSGYVDFMVARGVEEPERPYFFIQEFKKTHSEQDPKNQVLAEMLVALHLNQATIMRGAFIFGQHWHFMVLAKDAAGAYEYVVSKTFDSVWLDDLKQIYTN